MKKPSNKKLVSDAIKLCGDMAEVATLAEMTGLTEESVISAIRNLQYYDDMPVIIATRKVKYCKILPKVKPTVKGLDKIDAMLGI